jgi:hypothetical protein
MRRHYVTVWTVRSRRDELGMPTQWSRDTARAHADDVKATAAKVQAPSPSSASRAELEHRGEDGIPPSVLAPRLPRPAGEEPVTEDEFVAHARAMIRQIRWVADRPSLATSAVRDVLCELTDAGLSVLRNQTLPWRDADGGSGS